ncbi:MAG: hypothetical protein FI717_00475 [SAR202 cluster bacterium]|nr:hypothetical protein [SAR202 cluster bacterium]
MKRFFITALMAISLITLLAACGGDSTGTGPEPTAAQDAAVQVAPNPAPELTDEEQMEQYVELMEEFAGVLEQASPRNASGVDVADAMDEMGKRFEEFTGFFAGADPERLSRLVDEHEVALERSAQRILDAVELFQGTPDYEVVTAMVEFLPTIAIASSSGTVSEPVETPAGTISSLITPDEVSDLAGGVDLKTVYIDLRSRAAEVDPAQVASMESFDSLNFVTTDDALSLTLSTIKFDSAEAAAEHYDTVVRETPGIQDLPDTIGDAASHIELNGSGIGTMVIFKKGVWFAMLHTAQADGPTSLVDAAGVKSLAKTVAKRL